MAPNKKKARNNNKKKARAAAATPASPTVLVDGRMREKDARHFYKLLSVLAIIAVPNLNARREMAGTSPLHWNRNLIENTTQAREIVMSFVLQEIEWLVTEVDSGRHDALFHEILGKRLEEKDKQEIRSWKLHIEDDFFVVDHKANQGSVFVQVGRLIHNDNLMDGAPYVIEREFHEPRCFIVQGLECSLEKMLRPVAHHFQQLHPFLRRSYPELKDICMIQTALLPYNGGITYMATVAAPHLRHALTPQDEKAAIKKAIKTFNTAFGDGDTTVALYRKLDPVADASICRLAREPVNQGVPTMLRPEYTRHHGDEGTTDIAVSQVYWTPHHDRNHPDFHAMMERATVGPKPYLLEGFKSNIGQQMIIRDDDPCPFHISFGKETVSFADCCKLKYLERKRKAERTNNFMLIHVMYNPINEEERLAQEATFDTTNYVRMGYQDCGCIRMTVPIKFTSLIKRRMDTCVHFHASMEYKWIYWGYVPLRPPQMDGTMSFGDVTLDPNNGVIQADALTSARIGSLITELKNICSGIPVLKASLEMQPSPKVKPDAEALERNRALLQEGLATDVQFKIDKKANESMSIKCEYCGASGDDGATLRRCGCKAAYYCCKAHQKSHWKDHKETCMRLRGRS